MLPPLDSPRRTLSIFVMYAAFSMLVAPSVHFPCRFATPNPNTLTARRHTPIAARRVLPRSRTRLPRAVTLPQGERARRLALVPKPTCVTYVAVCVRELTDDDAIPRSTVTSSPSTTMGRRLTLSAESLAHSKQRLQELQEEHLQHPPSPYARNSI